MSAGPRAEYKGEVLRTLDDVAVSDRCLEARVAPLGEPVRVAFVGDDVVRLTIGEDRRPDYGILTHPLAPMPASVKSSAERGWCLERGGLQLRLETDPLRFHLEREDGARLGPADDRHFTGRLRLPPVARTPEGFRIAFALESREAVFGLGETWGALNQRGLRLVSRVEDALGVNTELAYKNVPFAWSPRGFGIFVNTTGDVVHHIGEALVSHRSYVLEITDLVLDLFLLSGATPAALLATYTGLTGRSPPPPRWSLGAWYSKAYHKDGEELLRTAREIRARGLPGDVLTLDGRAWQDTASRFHFHFDPKRYPDPKAMIDELHRLDFRLCCWEYPLVATGSAMFRDLEAKGYLLKHPETGAAARYAFDPEPFGDVLTPLPESGLVDFTHPAAYDDWAHRHDDLFALGVDVIKTDFGEQVPDDCVAWNGASGRDLHNVYPLLYNRCVFEATARHHGQGFVFGRSGWAGSQRYPGHWGGDPEASFEGLAASIRGALAWSLSGGVAYATDIGGFYGQPDAELFVRWTQAAVFASHLRFHGVGAREPWAFGAEAEAIVRHWLAVRYRLIPYLEAALLEAGATGMPLMRAMPLAFPDQPESWAFETQYLFGPDLLVAPVLRPGGQVTVYLPRGRWFDFETAQPLDGGHSLRLDMPLQRFPLFARAGAEIPLGPAVDRTAALPEPIPVPEVRRFPI